MAVKKIVSIAIAAIAGQLFAGTYTWTGASGNNDYSKPGNWDPASVPGESDDVVIDGAAVTWSGTHRIPNTLTLLNGASLEIGNEIQFGNTGVNPIIYGGTVRGGLVAAQSSGASLTLSDAALISSTTENNGFWQNGASYLNFTDRLHTPTRHPLLLELIRFGSSRTPRAEELRPHRHAFVITGRL